MSPIWRKDHEKSRVTVHMIGMGTSGASIAALCGHLAHQPPLYQWGFSGIMSFPTAFILAWVGLALFLCSRGEAADDAG